MYHHNKWKYYLWKVFTARLDVRSCVNSSIRVPFCLSREKGRERIKWHFFCEIYISKSRFFFVLGEWKFIRLLDEPAGCPSVWLHVFVCRAFWCYLNMASICCCCWFFPTYHLPLSLLSIMNCVFFVCAFIPEFGYLLLFDKQKCENHCYLFQ